MTNPLMLLSVQIGEKTTTELVAMTPGDAAALLDALKMCRSLMPGEVAQRLGAAFAAMQGLDVMPNPEELFADVPLAPPPPPAEMDMTPPLDVGHIAKPAKRKGK